MTTNQAGSATGGIDEISRLLVMLALREDIGAGDVTSVATVPGEGAGSVGKARVIAKAPLTVSGLAVATHVYAEVDPQVRVNWLAGEGARLKPADRLCEIEGPLRSILTGERVFLNFLGHLSGVATVTRACMDAVAGTKATVLDTRKTLPGMRTLEKAAVVAGGGTNHRAGLYDAFLIKENHVAAASGVTNAVTRCRALNPTLPLILEVRTFAELDEALSINPPPQVIMLDNFGPAELAIGVQLVGGRALVEASGGVNLANIAAIARTGVDRISLGMLTHSAPQADISMLVEGA